MFGIEIVSRPQHHQVWLQFRFIGNPNRILNVDNRRLAEPSSDEREQSANAVSVPVADWAHMDYFPLDQLDTFIGGDKAILGHPVVFCHRDVAFLDRNGHRAFSSYSSAAYPCAGSGKSTSLSYSI